MNFYEYDDYLNALECLKRNKYSKKAINVFNNAPECIKLDMYNDFEANPHMLEEEFMAKYKKIVYRLSVMNNKIEYLDVF